MRAAPERMISAARSKFAADSLLEGAGFEPSVPPRADLETRGVLEKPG